MLCPIALGHSAPCSSLGPSTLCMPIKGGIHLLSGVHLKFQSLLAASRPLALLVPLHTSLLGLVHFFCIPLALTPKTLTTLPFPWGFDLIQLMVIPPPFYGGQSPFHGGSYGGPPFQHQVLSYLSSGSIDDHWRLFNFPGSLPLEVPTFIHSPSPPRPSHGGSPHVPASVASTLASTVPPLHPLTHENFLDSLVLDLTMSFWPSTLATTAPPVIPSAVQPHPPVLVPPPPASKASSEGCRLSPVPALLPPPLASMTFLKGVGIPPVTAPAPLSWLAEPFKIPPIAGS
jgi:hypothetical protein